MYSRISPPTQFGWLWSDEEALSGHLKVDFRLLLEEYRQSVIKDFTKGFSVRKCVEFFV